MRDHFILSDFKLRNKRVLVRVDYNVPVDKKGRLLDDSKIKASLPTINYLLKKKARIILMSHLGRPNGKKVSTLKLDNVALRLSKLLKKKVVKIDNYKIPDEEIVLLENLRFKKEEKENDKKFAEKLASLGDYYVNDAFAVSHRKHASVSAITDYVPSCAGLLLEKEIKNLTKVVDKPKRPFIVVLGGSKLSTKLALIKSILKKADYLLLGGAMIFTFYKAQGLEIGKSLLETEQIKNAKTLLKNKKIILPIDIAVAKNKNSKLMRRTVPASEIGWQEIGLDIGTKSMRLFELHLNKAKTIVWNGPLGYIENKKYAKSSKELTKIISNSNAFTVCGGGETLGLINKSIAANKFNHISTGGGAMLNFLTKGDLPGIQGLRKNYKKYKHSRN